MRMRIKDLVPTNQRRSNEKSNCIKLQASLHTGKSFFVQPEPIVVTASMTTSSVIRVILERQECETQELRTDQINVENLRRLFQVLKASYTLDIYAVLSWLIQVNPTETWLKDELEGMHFVFSSTKRQF